MWKPICDLAEAVYQQLLHCSTVFNPQHRLDQNQVCQVYKNISNDPKDQINNYLTVDGVRGDCNTIVFEHQTDRMLYLTHFELGANRKGHTSRFLKVESPKLSPNYTVYL